MNFARKFIKAENATAGIELAFLLPFLGFLFFGMHDLTALISFNRKINSVASTVSDTVSQSKSTIVRSTVTDIFNATNMIMMPTPGTDVHVDVYGYRMLSGAATKRWTASNGNGPACLAPDTSNFAQMMSSSNDVVVAVACYSYPLCCSVLGQESTRSNYIPAQPTNRIASARHRCARLCDNYGWKHIVDIVMLAINGSGPARSKRGGLFLSSRD